MEDEKTARAAPTDASHVSKNSQDTLGPLNPVPATSTSPAGLHKSSGSRTHVGRTPPVTPPGRSASPIFTRLMAPSARGASSPEGGSPHHAMGKGVAAPTSAVDDVMEMFGRPRARSLSMRDRNLSLPAWEEEDDDVAQAAPVMEERRRTVSMSAAEGARLTKASKEAFPVRKQCRDCHLSPSFAVKGEPPIFCRLHQMAGMVNVLMNGCNTQGCGKSASYGMHGEDRQRCFSHKEEDMVHLLETAVEEDSL